MSALLTGLAMTAAFTPICWVATLAAFRRARSIVVVDTGLPNDLLDELERYSWVPGVLGGLLLSSAVRGLLVG